MLSLIKNKNSSFIATTSKSILLSNRSISSLNSYVSRVIKPTSLAFNLESPLFSKSDTSFTKQFQQYVRAFHLQFSCLSSNNTLVQGCFYLTCSYLLLPFLVTSRFYTFVANTRSTSFLPVFVQSLVTTIAIPVQSPAIDGCYGTTTFNNTFRQLLDVIKPWDNDFFFSIYKGSVFAPIFSVGNTKQSKEFFLMWSSFIEELEILADAEDYNVLLELSNQTFTGLNGTIRNRADFGLASYIPRFNYLNKLGLFKFRNGSKTDSYFIQTKGLDSISPGTLNIYYLAFYLFKGDINTGASSFPSLPVGGKTPIPGDTIVDISGLSIFECFTSLFSVRGDIGDDVDTLPDHEGDHTAEDQTGKNKRRRRKSNNPRKKQNGSGGEPGSENNPNRTTQGTGTGSPTDVGSLQPNRTYSTFSRAYSTKPRAVLGYSVLYSIVPKVHYEHVPVVLVGC